VNDAVSPEQGAGGAWGEMRMVNARERNPSILWVGFGGNRLGVLRERE